MIKYLCMHESPSILVIESNPYEVFSFTNTLKKLNTPDIINKMQSVSSLEEAKSMLCNQVFDVIICDLILPDSEGINTVLQIQKKSNSTPLIIVSDLAEEELIHETIKLGIHDFIPKEDLNPKLLARIIYIAIERHRQQASLKALSFNDELTGVYNRRGFMTRLEQQISLSKRSKKGFYLFFIDLDHLKQINDTYGHLAGDRALQGVAQCLSLSFRHHDIIGRIGGDEFAAVAIDAKIECEGELKQRLLNVVQNYNAQTTEPFSLSFGIGSTYYDSSSELIVGELLHKADKALYQDKRQSRIKPL